MRYILPAVAAIILAAPALAQDPAGISSSAIPRCAGKVGMDTRRSDLAFGTIMLDGMPWTTIERFTCELDTKGQALMFHASQLLPGPSEASALATVVAGSAAYARKMALPHGAELRVQLLDAAAQSPAVNRPIEPVILTEQVVRSGWEAPIPFVLHLPKHTPLEGRKLVVMARLVVRHRSLFQLTEPHVMTGEDLHKPLELVLDQVQALNR